MPPQACLAGYAARAFIRAVSGYSKKRFLPSKAADCEVETRQMTTTQKKMT